MTPTTTFLYGILDNLHAKGYIGYGDYRVLILIHFSCQNKEFLMDHTRDTNKAELHRIHTKLGEFPEFVKSASVSTSEDVAHLPSSVYAHPMDTVLNSVLDLRRF